MSQEIASGSDTRSEETAIEQHEPASDGHSYGSPSHTVETFGIGVSACILVGGIVGVAVAWALGANATVAMFLALGIGFILAPIVGLLLVEYGG